MRRKCLWVPKDPISTIWAHFRNGRLLRHSISAGWVGLSPIVLHLPNLMTHNARGKQRQRGRCHNPGKNGSRGSDSERRRIRSRPSSRRRGAAIYTRDVVERAH